MANSIKKYWPLAFALVILWLTIMMVFIFIVKQSEGNFIYSYDDAYIHMSIAKNFALYGIWGITKYEFSSTSSSLLWTFLISSIYYVFGVNEITPLILNIIFASLMVSLVYWLLCKQVSSSLYIFFVLLAVIFITSLPFLVFAGFEHILHGVITILFVYFSSKMLSKGEIYFLESDSVYLLLSSFFLPAVRYEGLFMVFIVCIMFVLRKRWKYSFLLGALSIIPVGIYGLISVKHGWSLVPNTLVMKGNMPQIESIKDIINFSYYLGAQFYKVPQILLLAVTALVLYIFRFSRQTVWENGQIMIVIFLAAIFSHIIFAAVDDYRYVIYFVALSFVAIVSTLFEYMHEGKQKINAIRGLIPRYVIILILVAFSSFSLSTKGLSTFIGIPYYSKVVFNQNYQLGLFLKQFYQGESVAVVDIGAVNYLADIKCLDVAGLGTLEIPEMMKNHEFNTEAIYKLAKSKGVKIVIIYDKFFEQLGGTPSQWIKVRTLKIAPHFNPISLYVTDPLDEKNLRANLEQFSLKF